MIEGGAERPDSERCALELLRAQIAAGDVDVVLIHDGARPCVSPELIAAAATTAATEGVVPVVQAPPLAIVVGTGIAAAPGHLMRAQTPQGAPAAWLLSAYDEALRAGFTGTDTASYLEHSGHPVRAIDGDPRNLKVTYREDLAVAAARLVD